MQKITALLSDNFVYTHRITDETEYEIQEIDARELLTPERIDLAAKLIYIQAVDTGVGLDFAREVYEKHIEAFSMGSYSEPGDPNKVSMLQYYNVFDALILDIRENGFDESKSLIPVGKDNVILDGAHRTACAIYFNKKVKVIRFPELTVKFDYSYFKGRHFSEELLNYMAIEYLRYSQQRTYCACFWPVAAVEKRDRAVELIGTNGKLLTETEISLTYQGLRNLMIQIYGHQDWVGTVENNFTGVLGKVDACYKPGIKTRIVLFQGGTLEETLYLKEEIRKIFQIGKHAVHISDSMEETVLMAELLFNPNSVQALKLGKPDAWPQFFHAAQSRKEHQDWLWPSSEATASYFGVCDYLEDGKHDAVFKCPRDYFTYMGIKIPSLQTAKKLIKDKDTCAALNNLLRSDDQFQSTAKRKVLYFKTKCIWSFQHGILRVKQWAAGAANAMGLYDRLHGLHNKLRGKTEQ